MIEKRNTYRIFSIHSRLVVLALLAWIFIPRVHAQLNATVYNDFNQTLINPYLINPAASDSSYLYNVRFDNVTELGVFSNVGRFYLDADRRISSGDKNEYHFLGVQIINSKQGDYINRSRFHARYSWYVPVSDGAALSSGISLGFVNYSFLTSQGGTGGSDLAPDGAVGIHYLRKNFAFGLSVQQIFNSVLMPVEQSFSLLRLYNIDVSKVFNITHELIFNTQAILQVPQRGDVVYGLTVLAEYRELFLLGVNNYFLRKTSVNLGVTNLAFLRAKFTVLGMYTLYRSDVTFADNSFEIFIGIKK